MVNVGTVNIPYMDSMGMGYGGFVPPTLEGIWIGFLQDPSFKTTLVKFLPEKNSSDFTRFGDVDYGPMDEFTTLKIIVDGKEKRRICLRLRMHDKWNDVHMTSHVYFVVSFFGHPMMMETWNGAYLYIYYIYIYSCIIVSYGGFLKCWYPITMGFPTKNDQFGVFWGYHHLRKQTYVGCCLLGWNVNDTFTVCLILYTRSRSYYHSLLREDGAHTYIYIYIWG